MFAPISSIPAAPAPRPSAWTARWYSTSTSRSSRLPCAQQLAQLLARVRVRIAHGGGVGCDADSAADLGGRRIEDVEQALFGGVAGLDRDPRAFFLAHHLDGDFGQVADHRFDVAADVADFGVARGLDLDERSLRQTGQAARDLGFTDAGRADHQDILGRDFVAQLGRDVLPPPAVTQRDRDGALGVVLADDIAVELRDDFPRRHHVRTCHCSFNKDRLLHAPLSRRARAGGAGSL